MGKTLTVVAMIGLAGVVLLPAIVTLADDQPANPAGGVTVIVPATGENPVIVQPGASPGKATYVIGERGQYYGAWAPPVPVPPGVLGPSSPLPCAVPYGPQGGGERAWFSFGR